MNVSPKAVSAVCVPFLSVFTFLVFAFFSHPQSHAGDAIKVAVTTSIRDSGLLDFLLPKFEQDTGISVQVLAVGTGAAIREGMDGNVDVVFVHDTAREERFVAEGWGTKRYPVMHNDFVIVGPALDPAGVCGSTCAARALRSIAEKEYPFFSRGDDSGTHARELALWKKSGLPLAQQPTPADNDDGPVFESPSGVWYRPVGQGMGGTLTAAAEARAYALTDRGTYIQQKCDASSPENLKILVEGDSALFNPYGVIPVNPEKHPHTRIDSAVKFAEWLVSPRGQSLIADYKLEGKQLFFPDAT